MPLVYLHGQLASWQLTTNPLGISSNASTHTAEDFTRGNGIGSLGFSANGVEAKAWPTGTRLGTYDYYEVCITPKSGITLNITGLQYSESRTNNGIRAYELFWSTNGFVTSNRIDSVSIPDNTNFRNVSISGLDIYACDTNPICFRWYGYHAESSLGTWKMKNDSLRINGTVLSPCMEPSTQASTVVFSNTTNNSTEISFTAGSGNGRLVVMRADSAVSAVPCNYVTYNAQASFGNGDDIGAGEFVVYNGPGNMVTVNGLDEGGLYYVSVFEYDAANPCFKKTNPASGAKKMLCMNPTDVEDLLESAGDTQVSLSWENASCFDELLVVAGVNSITGNPSGDGSAYTADAIFGNGTGFGAGEFPVYQGVLSKTEITGLTNGNTYYFKIFARLGTFWSSGIEIISKPEEGCFSLGGNDNIFINEIHYSNLGDDVDEGVEIAGPANKDLSSYELILYEFLGGDGIIYNREILSGQIDDEGTQFGAVWFPIPDMRESRAGIVLYNRTTETVLQFLSYRGAFTATEGEADGMTSENIAPGQGSSNHDTLSIQLLGTGTCPEDFYWAGLLGETKGSLNGINQNLLPIELVYFKASARDENVLVEWETAVEINNDYMVVEHSVDGRKFSDLGQIVGAGSTLEPQYYQYLHTNPVPGINYYRLRQVDFNGKETYHKIVAVQFETDEHVVLLYPTVSNDLVTIQLSAPLESTQQMTILDVTGRAIAKKNLEIGQSQWELAIDFFHPGHYFLQMEVNGDLVVKRFVKI